MNVYTFDYYRKEFSTSISMEQMAGAHREIESGLQNIQDEAKQKEGARIWEELWNHSREYMQDRLWDSDGQRGITQRKEFHNEINRSLRDLAKLLRAQGQQTKYLEEIGHSDKRGNANGDFACYIVFMKALCRR